MMAKDKFEQLKALSNAGGVTREPMKFGRLQKDNSKESSSKGHPEDDLTKECYTAFINKYPEYHKCLHHIPNENFVREISRKRQDMGVVAGVADFQLNIPAMIDGVFIAGLDIELKAGKNGQRWSQKEFEDYSLATWHIYRVVKSVDDFMRCIDEYMARVDPSIHASIKRLYSMWEPKKKELEAQKQKRSLNSSRSELAKKLGIDPSRIHGLE